MPSRKQKIEVFTPDGSSCMDEANAALRVNVVSGGGGGTQYVDGAERADATGTLVLVDDGTNLQSMSGDTSGRPNVVVATALPAGTNNIGDVDVLTLPALVASTANIGDVDVLTIAAGDNNIGNVDVVTLPAITITAGEEVDVSPNQAGNETTGETLRVLHVTDSAVSVRAIANSGVDIGDVDVLTLPAIPAGTNNIGDVDVLTIAAGDNNIGNVDIVTLPPLVAGTANIGDVDVLTLPNVTLAAGTNTNEIVGDVAHDVAVAGNPVRIAGRGVSADYTAVATGDTADFITDLNGKQIILPYAVPENFVNGVATLTTTSDVSVIAAGGAGIRNYITSISASNTSATNVRVDFKDGTTIIASFFLAASGGGVTHTMLVPIRGTANTAFNAALSAAVTDVRVSAQGYRAP